MEMAKTINEELVELLGSRLTKRIDEANILFLSKIGEAIKKIRDLTPSKAQQLVQILKYGGDYEKIIKEISKLTELNIDDIDKIFSNYAKKDQEFYKQFYQYRNIPYIPFEENLPLMNQTNALATISKNTMRNFTRSRALGYTIKGLDGKTRFTGLRETYEELLDYAVLNAGQGKESFDQSMSGILKQLGESGIKTLDYASGRSIRLDSMVRMHLTSGLTELHDENQRFFGEEFGADGVEISVHQYPAEDHEDVQGRQFTYEAFSRLQETGHSEDLTGKDIDIHPALKNGAEGGYHRPIGEYNCKHFTFSIICGVSSPEYSEERLQKIKEENQKGFDLDGKHYTMYEGTQLQRKLELEIRKQKDIQILAKESDNQELVAESQKRITDLNKKYKELSDKSGLPTKANRMKVSGYRRTKV